MVGMSEEPAFSPEGGILMRQSIFTTLCAGIILAVGPFNPAAAAYLTTGYQVGGVNFSCKASGEGSGFIDQDTPGCAEYIASGSFMAFGSGQASYSTLRGVARIGFDNLSEKTSASASAGGRYNDSLTIDIPGRAGEIVDLEFRSAMNGSLTAVGAYPEVYGVAQGRLLVIVNGTNLDILRGVRNAGDDFLPRDTNPGRVQITLGTPFSVDANLTAMASLDGSTRYVSGDVIADLSNSGGITSFTLFEPGAGGALIPEWDLSSASGQFGFYTAVPLPAGGWLLATGLLAIGGRLRPRRQGNTPR